MNEFLSMQWVQLTTLILSISVFIIIPLSLRAQQQQLSGEMLKTYKKVSKDIYVQTLLIILIPVILVLYSSLTQQNITKQIINTYLVISLTVGTSVLWLVYKNYDSEKNALFSSPKGFRKTRLSDIYKRNISSFTSALLATLIGGLSLIIVNGNFIEIPSWFWFACFLFTAFPIHALVWGIAIQSGVLNYDKNSKHGVK